MNKKVYIAGDMLTKGSQMLREKEKQDIEKIGLPFYNPADNKDINDKKNANQEGLAERIVKQDTDAIFSSDVIVIEPLPNAIGTTVELGQIHGMKMIASKILELAESDVPDYIFIDKVVDLARKIKGQKVFPHYEDIRRFPGVTESEDRRSLGINQYVYGVCLDLTNGKGFYEWDEILEELKQIKAQ